MTGLHRALQTYSKKRQPFPSELVRFLQLRTPHEQSIVRFLIVEAHLLGGCSAGSQTLSGTGVEAGIGKIRHAESAISSPSSSLIVE